MIMILSCINYADWGFSKNGKPTMTRKDGSPLNTGDIFGWSDSFAVENLQRISAVTLWSDSFDQKHFLSIFRHRTLVLMSGVHSMMLLVLHIGSILLEIPKLFAFINMVVAKVINDAGHIILLLLLIFKLMESMILSVVFQSIVNYDFLLQI
jgi:hypothetical protein